MQLLGKGSSGFLFSVLALAALACGDDSEDGAASCTAFAACGGDPTGTWKGEALCLTDGFTEALEMGLPAACQDDIVLEKSIPSTTLTIADGSFSEVGSVTLDWAMRLQADCISAAAGQSLDQDGVSAFCAAFADSISGADSPFISSSCATVQGACNCSARQEQDIDESGQYTIEGDVIVYSGGLRQQFCAAGDQLELQGTQGTDAEQGWVVYGRSP
jgi:hypothetical protein